MILPTATQNTTKSDNATARTNNLANEFQQTSIVSSKATPATKPSSGVKINTKKISMKEEFMCSKEELYRALTEKNVSHLVVFWRNVLACHSEEMFWSVSLLQVNSLVSHAYVVWELPFLFTWVGNSRFKGWEFQKVKKLCVTNNDIVSIYCYRDSNSCSDSCYYLVAAVIAHSNICVCGEVSTSAWWNKNWNLPELESII